MVSNDATIPHKLLPLNYLRSDYPAFAAWHSSCISNRYGRKAWSHCSVPWPIARRLGIDGWQEGGLGPQFGPLTLDGNGECIATRT
jgi:hypothetical protein